MLLSTPGLVLHTTPYAESSVVAKVFTRQLGLRSYIIKGVRGRSGRVKHRSDLNYTKELSSRHPGAPSDPVGNSLRFFMTEVLYKVLREAEPMPALWDYVENEQWRSDGTETRDVPIRFMLAVATFMGIEPLDNHSLRESWFDLQEGRFVGAATETTLSPNLSSLLHAYLSSRDPHPYAHSAKLRGDLLDALIAYFQLHLSGFSHFHSHEILHTILK